MLSSLVSTALQVLLAVAPTAVHPHHPKAANIGGAGGDIVTSYFTVDYNEEHLKSLETGFEWHLGFAMFRTEVPLKVGDTMVPAGSYKLQARLTDEPGHWNLVLKSRELAMAEMGVFFASRRGEDAVAEAEANLAKTKKKLAETGEDKTYLLKTRLFDQEHEEHLRMTVLNHGFATVQRMSEDPAGGVEFELRISFGDMHHRVMCQEVFGKDGAKSDNAKDK